MPDYTPDYFIEKLSRIPEEQWCTGELRNSRGQRCALGHLGASDDSYDPNTPESTAMIKLFKDAEIGDVPDVNDYEWDDVPILNYPTPKQRILAALRFIKERLCKSP